MNQELQAKSSQSQPSSSFCHGTTFTMCIIFEKLASINLYNEMFFYHPESKSCFMFVSFSHPCPKERKANRNQEHSRNTMIILKGSYRITLKTLLPNKCCWLLVLFRRVLVQVIYRQDMNVVVTHKQVTTRMELVNSAFFLLNIIKPVYIVNKHDVTLNRGREKLKQCK